MAVACSRHETGRRQRADGTENKPTLADIFRQYGEAYRRKHRLPTHYCRVMRAIEHCRTRHMGGHLHHCQACGAEVPVYNPCGNRHCPRCQHLARAKWLARRTDELLPVGYFHYVFTLPHDLNPLVLCNRKIMLNILFDSVRNVLTAFAEDPQWRLKGQIGCIAVLHTWSQTLLDHFHLHCIIPGGVLRADGSWKQSRETYLFRIDSLSKAFRNAYLDSLNRAYQSGKLLFPGRLASWKKPKTWDDIIRHLQTKNWIAYAKRPFAQPEQVLDYLGRYTHRVAISNHRILKSEPSGHVQFKYKDRRDNNKTKTMRLSAEEFIRRFLLHVLPRRFMKIRYFGYLAHSRRKSSIQRIRSQIPEADARRSSTDLEQVLADLTAAVSFCCPRCGGKLSSLTIRIPPSMDPAQYHCTGARSPPVPIS